MSFGCLYEKIKNKKKGWKIVLNIILNADRNIIIQKSQKYKINISFFRWKRSHEFAFSKHDYERFARLCLSYVQCAMVHTRHAQAIRPGWCENRDPPTPSNGLCRSGYLTQTRWQENWQALSQPSQLLQTATSSRSICLFKTKQW